MQTSRNKCCLTFFLQDNDSSGQNSTEDTPEAFLCPITYCLMEDPVIASDGHTYERKAIEDWFQSHDTSPMTNETLDHLDLIPNYLARSQIQELEEARKNAQLGT